MTETLKSIVNFVINNFSFVAFMTTFTTLGLAILLYGFWCMYRDSQLD